MATIDGYYFEVCTKGAERQGRSVAALVAGTGLDPADFARPGWRGPVEAMAGLVRNIWASLDDEWMGRSEEHTSELQSLMRISYAVFCLKKKNKHTNNTHNNTTICNKKCNTHINTRVANS